MIHATSDEVSTSATETGSCMLIRRTSFRRYHRDMFGMIEVGKKKTMVYDHSNNLKVNDEKNTVTKKARNKFKKIKI